MPQKNGAEQTDISGSTSKSQRPKIIKPSDDDEKKISTRIFPSSLRAGPEDHSISSNDNPGESGGNVLKPQSSNDENPVEPGGNVLKGLERPWLGILWLWEKLTGKADPDKLLKVKAALKRIQGEKLNLVGISGLKN